MSKNNKNNKSSWNSSSNPSKNIDQHVKQLFLEEDSVIIIVTRPPISSHVSPIGQHIVISKKNVLVKKPDHNWKYCGKQHYSYYQPQLAIHNHLQQYRHYRIIQQYPSKNDYDREKGGAHGIIHSGIPTPEKHATPIIPQENGYYSRDKPPDD